MLSDLASFVASSSSMAEVGGVSTDKNHLLSCLDLGRDSVIPLALVCAQTWRERSGGIDFQSEGRQRIELRCVAKTRFGRSNLLAGQQISVAYSEGAVQYELDQVLLMLIA